MDIFILMLFNLLIILFLELQEVLLMVEATRKFQ